MVSDKIKKWWEENAKQFQEEREIPIEINYGVGGSNEDNLKLLGDVSGKNVLEIGCGGAQCGIAFAKKGANVTAIDVSEEELKFAKRLAEENKVDIKFFQGDIINLGQISSESQDIVFSSWAFMYVTDLESCIKEAHRVLRNNGIFVFSTDHPFWRRISKDTLKVKKSYFETGSYEEPFMRGVFVAHDHKISDFVNYLANAGFVIEKMIEPNPNDTINEDPWVKDYDESKIEAMKYLPRTIIFKAKKCRPEASSKNSDEVNL